MLMIALKGANEGVQEKFFGNMSTEPEQCLLMI